MGAHANGIGSTVVVRNAIAPNGSGHGVYAEEFGVISVLGDVTANNGSANIGAKALTGGEIIIEGELKVGGAYIQVDGIVKTQAQYEATTTKAGYLTYTGGTSTVWVKGETPSVCEIGATKYSSLSAALTAHTNGQTIRLLDNIEHNTTITINGKTITFDLNGKNLDVSVSSGNGLYVSSGGIVNMSGSGNFNVSSSSEDAVFVAGSGSKATVTNATSTKDGGYAGAWVQNNGEVTVLGTAMGAGSIGTGAFVNIGGKITVENASGSYGVFTTGSGSQVTVRNVTVTGSGNGVRAVANSEILVLGDVSASGSGSIGAYALTGGQITIDGTITASGGATYITVGATIKTAAQYEATTTKAGYLTYTDGTNTVWVKGETPAAPVCEIGATKYSSLSAALTAHTNGQTIHLLDNIDYNTEIHISGKTITFDLNGKNLNVNNPAAVGYGLYV